MQKLILTTFLILVCFPALAGGFSFRTLTAFNSPSHQANLIQATLGIYYSTNNFRVGISYGRHTLLSAHLIKQFKVSPELSFGVGIETGYRADNQGYLVEDFRNLYPLISLSYKLTKDIQTFITVDSASLELTF